MPDSPSTNLHVALYVRVSTEEQREGHTIQSQIAELEKFAAANGWIVTKTYQDEGWTGSILARPQLDQLRDDAAKGLFSAVILNDVDRLARDVTHLGIIKRDLERNGVQVIFRKLPNENSPTHNLMVNILGSFAEFEREMIADRTRRGRRHKVEVRKEYLGSRPPYGYGYVPIDRQKGDGGYLTVNPEQALIVQKMFAWVDAEGLSARRVLTRLNDLGLRAGKGGKWAKSSVLRVLHNETYAGVWHYYKQLSCEPTGTPRKYRKSLKSSRRARPRTEWLPIWLPEDLKIIDRDVWTRVQIRLNQNFCFSPRNSKHNYLLKGLVQCGACAGRYIGDPNKGFYSYRCINRCKQLPSIGEQILNEVTWQSVSQALLNPDRIAEQVRQLDSDNSSESSAPDNIDFERAMAQLQKERARLLEAYRLEIISPTQLKEEMDKLKPRELMLKECETVHTASPKQTSQAIRLSIEEYCRRAASRLESSTFEQRQDLLREIVREITFHGSSVRIRGVIPVSPNSAGETANIETPTSERHARNTGDIATPTLRRHGRNSADESHSPARSRQSSLESTVTATFECGFTINAPVVVVPVVNPKGRDGKFVGKRALLADLIRVLVNRRLTLSQTNAIPFK